MLCLAEIRLILAAASVERAAVSSRPVKNREDLATANAERVFTMFPEGQATCEPKTMKLSLLTGIWLIPNLFGHVRKQSPQSKVVSGRVCPTESREPLAPDSLQPAFLAVSATRLGTDLQRGRIYRG